MIRLARSHVGSRAVSFQVVTGASVAFCSSGHLAQVFIVAVSPRVTPCHLAFSVVFLPRWLAQPCPSMFQPGKLRSRTERPPLGRPRARRSVAITAWAPVTLVVAVHRPATCMNSSEVLTNRADHVAENFAPIQTSVESVNAQSGEVDQRFKNLETFLNTFSERLVALESKVATSSSWPLLSVLSPVTPVVLHLTWTIHRKGRRQPITPAGPRPPQEWTRTVRTHGVLSLCAARVRRRCGASRSGSVEPSLEATTSPVQSGAGKVPKMRCHTRHVSALRCHPRPSVQARM